MGINDYADGFYKYQPLNHGHAYGGDDNSYGFKGYDSGYTFSGGNQLEGDDYFKNKDHLGEESVYINTNPYARFESNLDGYSDTYNLFQSQLNEYNLRH